MEDRHFANVGCKGIGNSVSNLGHKGMETGHFASNIGEPKKWKLNTLFAICGPKK